MFLNIKSPANNIRGRILFLLLFLLLGVGGLRANDIEIRYHAPGGSEVYLVWGINDWKFYDNPPAGTTRKGKVMHTKMNREGADFVIHINIEAHNDIEFTFFDVRYRGPFHVYSEYWDTKNPTGKKGYQVYTDSSQVVKIESAIDYSTAKGRISFARYGKFLLVLLAVMTLVVIILRKYHFKHSPPGSSKPGIFIALTLALAMGLFWIRIYMAELIFPFLVQPLSGWVDMASGAWDDMKFASILVVFFGTLFLLLKKGRKLVLTLFAITCLLSITAALLNVKVTEMIGRPFNYQWLYYSDFFNSTDASKAIGANVSWLFIMALLLLIGAFFFLVWLCYNLYRKWPLLIGSLFPVFFLAALIANSFKPMYNAKTANPISYFINSVNRGGTSSIAEQQLTGICEFDKKNVDSLPGKYQSLFATGAIKNVIILVLESTPAEYIDVYDSSYHATPFIDSISKQAAVFQNIYAHTPATNKSMFSILCSTYPELSFKTITKEAPAVALPSLTSELKTGGYRSLFLNSGDNRFQNAEGFLKNRGFDDILDFRTNDCGRVFSDSRYSKNNLDGVDDSCLAARFFNWQQQKPSAPFFSMMWTFQTHYPYFSAAEPGRFKTGNASLDRYLDALHRADETLQQLVEGLKLRHLFDQTLIVLVGDHGEAFGRHNQTTHASNIFEENLHVPLLFINPTVFSGERLPVTGGISDIAPTIMAVMNRKAPSAWQGENLFSLNRRKAVYFFAPYSDILFGLREDHYKFIFNASDNTYSLYDLSVDRYETTNIAAEKPAYVQQQQRKLQSWIRYQNAYMKKVAYPDK